MQTGYSEMDFSELTKIILTRIQKVEPENALKILGCILLTSPSEQRMVQLAFWPEEAILPTISDAKATLTMLSSKQSALTQPLPDPSQNARSFSPAVSRPFPSPPSLHPQAPYWDPQFAPDQQHPINTISFPPRPYVDGCGLRNQPHFLRMEEQMDPMNPMAGPNFPGHCYHPDDSFGGSLDFRARGRSSSLPEFPIKPCHYFYKGYCKHGDGCKYFHSPGISDGESHLYNTNLDDIESEDHGFSPGSLEKLEREITELLKSKGGVPISIASLPMLYFEKYGKNLQADGYLTESQRHGKAGLNLTKLLARLKNSIRLIDKPHGQHSVILAEDAPRYMECMNQRNDSTAIASSSHQIYLTFPAESTFTSDDVSNYFKQYGPVRDVRIPCQDKRMFGFVSFLYPETVKDILTKRNPHYICGARVLVKPYKEKSRTPERPYMEKFQPAVQYPPHYLTMDPELHALPRQSSSSRLFRKQQLEHNDRLIEFERRRLSEFNLALKPLTQPCYNYSMEEYRVPEGLHELSSTDHFSYTLDALNNGSMNDEKAKSTVNSLDDQESQIELPDSPFASPPIERGIDALV